MLQNFFFVCFRSKNQLKNILYLKKSYHNLNLPKPIDLSYSKFEALKSKNENKNPILIYHGLFGCKTNWRSLGKIISTKTNRDVYILDVRNHGESPHTKEFTYPCMVNDAIHFLKKNEIQKAIFLGHSLGGRAFANLSFLAPDLIEKLIIVDVHPFSQIPANEYLSQKFLNILKSATIDLRKQHSISLSSARKFLDDNLKVQIPDTFLRQFFLMSLCEKNNEITWKFNLEIMSDFLNKGLNKIELGQSFNGQTLLIYGGKSVYFGEQYFDSVREIFPKIIFKCVKQGNHYLHVTHSNEFIDILVPFVKN